MSQEQRVILFIFVVFLVVLYMQKTMLPLPQGPSPTTAPAGVKGETTTAPLAFQETGTTAAAIQARPEGASETAPGRAEEEAPALEPGKTIAFRTATFDVEFDTRGARPRRWDIIDEASLEKHPETHKTMPFSIIPAYLKDSDDEYLPLEVTFKDRESGNFAQFNRLNYDCQLSSDSKGAVTLRCVSPPIYDMQIVKTFTFPGDGFVAGLKIEARNLSESSRSRKITDGVRGLGLTWGPGIGQYDPAQSAHASGLSYIQAAVALDKEVRNITPSKRDEAVEVEAPAQWMAMKDKTFLVAIVPNNPSTRIASVKALQRMRNPLPKELAKTQSPPYTVIGYTEPFDIEKGQSATLDYKIFVGPMRRLLLSQTDYGLSRILFFSSWGWFRALALGMMILLDHLHAWCHNYGVAIILLTVVVRIATYPLTHKSMKLTAKTQAEMARIKPELDAINAKYKNDFQAKNKAVMEAYKKHGINPMAPLRGCVPMLIQLPIFFALYRLLDVSVELRGASFLWVQDLAQPDRLFAFGFTLPLVGWQYFNLLPFLMALTTVLTQLMSMTQINDPNQKMMLYMMPVMMLFMLYNLSSGLFVYWITSNIWQAVQQHITNRLFKKDQPGGTAPAKA